MAWPVLLRVGEANPELGGLPTNCRGALRGRPNAETQCGNSGVATEGHPYSLWCGIKPN
jgi:hypothetical protein